MAQKYQKPERVTVDLVQHQRTKAATTVRHLLIGIHWSQRNTVIADVVQYYGSQGSSIVFCSTKKDASDLQLAGTIKVESQALHGDMKQAQRESTLKALREGKFKCLIATDVAARGIDVSGVDLVINSQVRIDGAR